ncbi:MAG: ABC transporter ATP-binding protein [Rhizobium sp. 63-7]|nr:MAG: ABC transporter ATP-binding protein [Rhizobium sp. 63-7]
MLRLTDLYPVLSLFLRVQRCGLLLGAVLAAATMLAGLALLGLSGWFVTATALAGLSAGSALAFDVFAPSAGIRFFAIARTAGRYGERLVTHDATLKILATLREKLFRGWSAPGAARDLVKRPARLLFRLTADIDALDSLYLRVLVPGLVAFCAALTAGIALGFLSVPLGLAVGLLLLVGGSAILFLAAGKALRPAGRRLIALEALRARTIDMVSGRTDLVMTGRLAAARAAAVHADERLGKAEDRLNRIETGTLAALGMLGACLTGGVLLAVAALAEAGAITAPVAAFGVLLTLAAVEPFAGLRRGALELGRSLLAARRIAPRLRAAAETSLPQCPAAGEALRFDGVTAAHAGAPHPVFRELSLAVEWGECLAVIGASGSGKTTLLGLAAGEIPVLQGTVARLPSTLMTQRTELFEDTLRDNLKLADPDANDGRLWQALADAGLKNDIAALGGLDIVLGEGGLGLSGGQSRRLALARLFLRDTPLWLLDEPTDGLDGPTASDVLDRLAARAAEKTVVIATHLRRKAAIADRIVHIDRGRIIEISRHGEAAFEMALQGLRPD